MTQPKFVPKPGQVDYTTIRYAPTVNIVVTHAGKLFCVKRSPDMRLYPNYWDWVCGFLDDNQSIEDKAREELHEELGLEDKDIAALERGKPWVDEAPQYQKTWLIIPVLARVTVDTFRLDWEASEGAWFTPAAVRTLDMVPGSLQTAAAFFPELDVASRQ